MNGSVNSQITEHAYRKSSTSSENSSYYSSSEGTYTLNTSSESEVEADVETVDANGQSTHENDQLVCTNRLPDVENGTTTVLGVTPEPPEFLMHPTNTGTYKIKTKDSSLEFRNGDLTGTTTPATGSNAVSARRRHSFASPEKLGAAGASSRSPAFARLRRLPLLRCAAAAYDAARASSSLGWAVAAAEAGARLALAPVVFAALPFARACSGPQNCVGRAICKGLDAAEALLPCIGRRPCQMCCGEEVMLSKR